MSKKQKIFLPTILVVLSLLVVQCQSYYQRNIKYHTDLQRHQYKDAEQTLDHFKLLKKERNELLFNLEKGKLAHLQHQFSESNTYFNKADVLIEDYKKSAKDNALELVSNPQMQLYQAEDFEKVFIHYYKALNYIYLNDMEGALVEAKRINLKLQEINDKYKNDKNKYGQDAFGHIFMGMLYQANNDANNAFIAFRNAVDIYFKNDNSYMNVAIPNQLKKDIIFAAYQSGFTSEQVYYEQKFDLKLDVNTLPKKELILFLENGLSPVKTEWSLNFTVIPGNNGLITFVNKDLNLNFSFNYNSNNQSASSLRLVRVAFPKYSDRTSKFTSSSVAYQGNTYTPELVEDLNCIARETLNDRFLREMTFSLLRMFVKQSAELAVRNQNQELGALVGVFNAITEKADTRQWQTLPNKISYLRIPLEEQATSVSLTLFDRNGGKITKEIPIPFSKNKIVFANFHSLEAINDY